MLQRASDKDKAQHDKHCIPHSFQIGDQVWLHLEKERFSGPHRKLNPLRYGPYTILKKIGENYFELSIPPYLGLHSVFNVDLLRPYFPPLLEQINLQPKYLEYIHPYVQETLVIDTIIGQQVHHTRI